MVRRREVAVVISSFSARHSECRAEWRRAVSWYEEEVVELELELEGGEGVEDVEGGDGGEGRERRKGFRGVQVVEVRGCISGRVLGL